MTPFYFGRGGRRLFGVYDPSVSAGTPRAAVLCHPWGTEYIYAHRSMRQLSAGLAGAGIHTLRFDYLGSGDSDADMAEVALSDWRDNIVEAAREIMDITGAPRVSLVGLRLGASLAAQAAFDLAGKVDALVMWDPVLAGSEYVQELYEACRALPIMINRPVPRHAVHGGGYEVLGFPLTTRMISELNELDLRGFDGAGASRMLAVTSASESAHAAVQEILSPQSGVSTSFERIESLPAWKEDWPANVGVVPVKVLKGIIQWLS